MLETETKYTGEKTLPNGKRFGIEVKITKNLDESPGKKTIKSSEQVIPIKAEIK